MCSVYPDQPITLSILSRSPALAIALLDAALAAGMCYEQIAALVQPNPLPSTTPTRLCARRSRRPAMAYVAARGGEQAIQQAEQLFRQLTGEPDAGLVQLIEQRMPYLVDRVMGEGSLYAPQLAALALAQPGGDPYEATLLLRAYRSTQPRLA